MQENVYLIPFSNGTFTPQIAEKSPCDNAVLLATEGTYPTLLSYVEYDPCGCGHIYGVEINNRAELMRFLFASGNMHWGVVRLWDYDLYQSIRKDLYELFVKGYETRPNAADCD